MALLGRGVGGGIAGAYMTLHWDTSRLRSEAATGVRASNLSALGRSHGTAFGSTFASSAGKSMRGAEGEAASTGRRMGQRMAHATLLPLGGMVRGIGAAFAVIGAARLFSSAITNAREATQVMRITNQVIRSTGGVAGVSAGQVSRLAGSIAGVTGIEDEAVQAGENMLLTFTKVRNETGRGNDVFNRATSLITDMAAAMHGGDVNAENMRKTAILVGKALQDPVKGFTSLRRVGVALDKQQQAQIKSMVAQGNVMGAQKLILRELGREFGGVARAAADPMKRLHYQIQEVLEAIGRGLLPVFNSASNWILKSGIPAFTRFWHSVGGPAASAAAGLFRDTFTVLGTGRVPGPARAPRGAEPGPMRAREPALAVPPVTPWQRILIVVHDIAVTVGRELRPLLLGLGRWITQVLWPALVSAGRAVAPAFRDLGAVIKSVWGSLKILWQAFAPFLGPVLILALGALVIAFRGLALLCRFVLAPAIRVIAVVAGWVMGRVWVAVQTLAGLLQATWGGMWRAGVAVWHAIYNAAQGCVSGIRTGWSRLTGFVSGVLGGLKTVFRVAWLYIQLGALKAVSFILDKFSRIPFIGRLFQGAARTVRAAIQSIQDKINGVEGKVVRVGISMYSVGGVTHPGPRGPVGGGWPTRARGGEIRGPGGPRSDQIPLWASDREYMIQAAAHQAYGTAAMEAVNAGRAVVSYRHGGAYQVRGLADGGPVGRALLTPRAVVPKAGVIQAAIVPPLRELARIWAKTQVRRGLFTTVMGDAIAREAERWVGHVPYVWGGTSPAGWDCSGMVTWILNKFGFHPPRVAEAQRQWARAVPHAVRGGLAFFTGADGWVGGALGGGAYAGHVGIPVSTSRMVNAYGTGYGTINSPIYGSSGSVLGFGVPPSGWYDRGGWLPPGVSLAVNQTGRHERVVAPGEDRPHVTVNLGGVVVREQADVDLLSRRIAFAVSAAGFG